MSDQDQNALTPPVQPGNQQQAQIQDAIQFQFDNTAQQVVEFASLLSTVTTTAAVTSRSVCALSADLSIALDSLLDLAGVRDFSVYLDRIDEGAKQGKCAVDRVLRDVITIDSSSIKSVFNGLLPSLTGTDLLIKVVGFFNNLNGQLMARDFEDRTQLLWDVQRDQKSKDYKITVISLLACKSKSSHSSLNATAATTLLH